MIRQKLRLRLRLKQFKKMYLEKNEKNKYTVGKLFRKLKRLRLQDKSAKLVPMPRELQQYYDQLVDNGLLVKNLKFAMFQTANGLKYPGLIATQKILSNTILVKVPVDLLLTTRHAFFSEIEKQQYDLDRIFVQNPAYYAKRFTGQWQDRMILTFLLYEYQKGPKSPWYNLIRNLPKDIDYAIFWNKQQIQFLEDEWLSIHIKQQKQRFEKECQELIQILRNYPQFFHKETVTKENVIWLHTHLVTRCFGKYFQYTTMVPFAELFNHQCVDVYYTMYYKPGNPFDEKEQFYEEKELTSKDIDECDSSDGSYDADDFTYENEDIDCPTQGQFWEIENEKYGLQIAKDIRSILYHMFTFINFSDSISLPYIKQVLKQLGDTAQIDSWESRKKKCQEIHTLNVTYIRKVKQFYKKIKRKYYTYAITQKQKLTEKRPEDKPEQGVNYFEQEWPKDKFDQFYMLCSTKDQFEKGSQVFFCYGRLPNKLLLMRYGIALQHNKYDHMFVKISVQDQVKNNAYLKTVLKEIQMKKFQRFKIKRTKMCIELVAYFRMKKWKYGGNLDLIFLVTNIKLQLEVLQQTKEFYNQLLKRYKAPLNQNEQSLKSRNIGYHKYFALVYKVEQQRMISDQIRLIEYAQQVLFQLRNEEDLKKILTSEVSEDKLRFQIMMEGYFKLFQIPKI